MVELEGKNQETMVEPLILALDTASKLTSIAISKGDRVVANFCAMLDENRSTKLWDIIDFFA